MRRFSFRSSVHPETCARALHFIIHDGTFNSFVIFIRRHYYNIPVRFPLSNVCTSNFLYSFIQLTSRSVSFRYCWQDFRVFLNLKHVAFCVSPHACHLIYTPSCLKILVLVWNDEILRRVSEKLVCVGKHFILIVILHEVVINDLKLC
jgi:hypothetical protein